jgi:hypothetical protein
MTPNNLRRACEAAGLVPAPHGYDWMLPGVSELKWMYLQKDPALPPYVAELLLAKAREGSPEQWEAFDLALTEIMPDSDTLDVLLATAEQRITAACKVLGVVLEADDGQ